MGWELGMGRLKPALRSQILPPAVKDTCLEEGSKEENSRFKT